MELESTEIAAQVYETLKNINLAISRLQNRSVGITSANDYLTSPTGMEKLDAACMVLIAVTVPPDHLIIFCGTLVIS